MFVLIRSHYILSLSNTQVKEVIIMPSVTTTSVITFCIVAVILLGALRFFILARVPIRLALSNFRARYDPAYAERRELEFERLRIIELENQQAIVAAHAARTRLWYGYRFPETRENDHHPTGAAAVPIRNLPPLNVTLTSGEVDFNFPSKAFESQEASNYSVCQDEMAKKADFEVVLETPVNTPMPEKNFKKQAKLPDQEENQGTEEKPISMDDVDIPDNACIVCLEEMRKNDMTKLLTCGHLFHSACITEWLVCHKAVCPLCRYDYSTLHKDQKDLESATSQPLTG